MRVLDLFSGIGGFSIGLERAGMTTVAFCEIEPFSRSVLKKHWPEVPCYDDVRKLTAARLAADGVAVDVICGGFPCQDISIAGKGEGIDGSRSGLWSEFARLICDLRPRYVIVENVSALLNRGLDRVLGDLAALGYDAEWHCIPASAIGAPHRRDRIWIMAYPAWDGGGRPRFGVEHGGEGVARAVGQREIEAEDAAVADADSSTRRRVKSKRKPDRGDADARRDGAQGDADAREISDTNGRGRREQRDVAEANGGTWTGQSGVGGQDVADTDHAGRGVAEENDARGRINGEGQRMDTAAGRSGDAVSDAEEIGQQRPARIDAGGLAAGRQEAGIERRDRLGVTSRPRLPLGPRALREWAYAATTGTSGRTVKPGLGRTFDGLPAGLDSRVGWGPGWEDGVSRVTQNAADKIDRRKRLICLGNAVVPDIPEIIGQAIVAHAAEEFTG